MPGTEPTPHAIPPAAATPQEGREPDGAHQPTSAPTSHPRHPLTAASPIRLKPNRIPPRGHRPTSATRRPQSAQPAPGALLRPSVPTHRRPAHHESPRQPDRRPKTGQGKVSGLWITPRDGVAHLRILGKRHTAFKDPPYPSTPVFVAARLKHNRQRPRSHSDNPSTFPPRGHRPVEPLPDQRLRADRPPRPPHTSSSLIRLKPDPRPPRGHSTNPTTRPPLGRRSIEAPPERASTPTSQPGHPLTSASLQCLKLDRS